MTTYRGMDGALALGGILNGIANPRVATGIGAGAGSVDVGASTSLYGVVMPGDTFTFAGETGTPTHTVTGGPYVAAAGQILGMTFTPVTASAVALNSAISFGANSVGEARIWQVTADLEELEDSALGDKWRTFVGGIASWQGTGQCWLDHDDPKQGAVIDQIMAATPTPDLNGVLFNVATNKQWYAPSILSQMEISGVQSGSIIAISFRFRGKSALLPNWV